jgi:hypothetical protein
MIIARKPSVFPTPSWKLFAIFGSGMPEPTPTKTEASMSATKALHLNFATSTTRPMIATRARRRRPFGESAARGSMAAKVNRRRRS